LEGATSAPFVGLGQTLKPVGFFPKQFRQGVPTGGDKGGSFLGHDFPKLPIKHQCYEHSFYELPFLIFLSNPSEFQLHKLFRFDRQL
jgi:hypothetical protein